jgi:hypothetical protein
MLLLELTLRACVVMTMYRIPIYRYSFSIQLIKGTIGDVAET